MNELERVCKIQQDFLKTGTLNIVTEEIAVYFEILIFINQRII